MALADTQQQRLLELLREAGAEPVAFAELHAGGVSFPAAAFSELELNGYPSSASMTTGVWPLPSAVDRQISGWRAFPWYRSPLALGAGLGPQSAARGRVDALVAIVPADPIARRGIATEHFLNRTRAGSTGD
jgi:hypothetical protein